MKEKWGSPRVAKNVIVCFRWLSLVCNHGRLAPKDVAVYVWR
jgi:hypothetical protein